MDMRRGGESEGGDCQTDEGEEKAAHDD